MSLNLLLIWANFGPYHLARLARVRQLAGPRGVETGGLELAGREQAYAWQPQDTPLQKTTLFPGQNVEDIGALAFIRKTWQTLERLQPDVLAICGYDRAAMLTALAWAKMNRRVTIFMSESKADDRPRHVWKECLKGLIVRRYNAALVGGAPQKEYAVSLGLPQERVFIGYDVVDNEHYAQGAEAARRQEAAIRGRLGLPRPYFLNVGRFIDKKNLFRLLEAYGLYRQWASGEPWDLVLCGSGPLEDRLKEAAAAIPGVHFPGFKQAEELPAYYGLAQVFIIPSSNFEQWGLVVNEAMAAGLAVLVSRACGCAPDLVQEGVNGFTFDPYDVEGLARLMVRMSSGEVDLTAMGKASQHIISHWTPEVFAENLLKAMDAALAQRQTRKAWWQRLFASS
jgi:1,2-diacylglycerol 3-alpha-glucosyltransferase